MYLTNNELEIMDVLWASEGPLSRGQLLEQSEDKSWKSSSVHILLNSLLKKGAIYEAGFARCGKTCGRTYAPSVSVEEYYVSTLSHTRCRPDPAELFRQICKALPCSGEDIDRCRQVLAQAK